MDVQQEFFSEKPPVAECQSAEQAVRDPHAMDRLTRRIGKDKYVRLGLDFKQRCEDSHLKDLVATEMDDQRGIVINGRRLVNFGSDSFLGLDRDPRVQQTIARHLETWGTHNGPTTLARVVGAV